MKHKLIIDGTAVYELDEECIEDKKCREALNIKKENSELLNSEKVQNMKLNNFKKNK